MAMHQIRTKDAVTKSRFHSMLRQWIEDTNDETIGPEGIRGQTPWIHVRDGSTLFFLNADTRRKAVETYLQFVALHGDNIAWTIVPSQRGNMTAVAYGPEVIRHKPFYLYTHATPANQSATDGRPCGAAADREGR